MMEDERAMKMMREMRVACDEHSGEVCTERKMQSVRTYATRRGAHRGAAERAAVLVPHMCMRDLKRS